MNAMNELPMHAVDTAWYWPMLALIAWTALIGTLAARRRVREVRRRGIALRAIATARDVARVLEDTQAMDNFNNLLQVPVLFHLWCLAMAQTGSAPAWLQAAAWGYVVLRMWHSHVQLTHNRVLRRFAVWAAGNAWLALLWVALAVRLVLR